MKPVDLIMCTGFAVMFLVVFVQMYLTNRFLKELKVRFADQWRQLGSPTLFLNNSISNNAAVFNFLWKKKYLELHDDDFSVRCSTARTFSVVSLVLGVIWIFLGLVVILLTKK